MERKVYLDSASTTPTCSEAVIKMRKVFDLEYGNSSSLHKYGRDAVAYLDESRNEIAKLIGANDSEIYFTSGGTESNNWAIRGIAYANKDKGNHLITSSFEHPSVLEVFKSLEKEGFRVTYLPVDKHGFINMQSLIHEIGDDTILVSIMTANNEVGTIQNISAISHTVRDKGAIFHADATQALGSLRIDVEKLGIDAMTFSSHKIYGPKGAGALYVKKGIKINQLLKGGHQERGKRPGTTNVAAIAGFGAAAKALNRDFEINKDRLKSTKDYFVRKLRETIPGVYLNGTLKQSVDHILNVSFDQIEGESIMLMLDLKGVAVSTGSACSSGSLEASHVLKAMGVEDDLINGAIRFSFLKITSKNDVDYVIGHLEEIVKRLRKISPLRARKRSK